MGLRQPRRVDPELSTHEQAERVLKAIKKACPDAPERVCRACGVTIPSSVRSPTCRDCTQAERRERLVARLEQVWESVPDRYRWAEMGTELFAKRVQATDKTIEVCRQAERSLLIVGESGVGKTSLAVAKLRHVLREGYAAARSLGFPKLIEERDRGAFRRAAGCLFVSCQDIARSAGDPQVGAELVDRAAKATLLVLDDLGSETVLSPVADLIHRRHDRMKETIYTTYHSKESLADRYGDGVVRRVSDALAIRLGER